MSESVTKKRGIRIPLTDAEIALKIVEEQIRSKPFEPDRSRLRSEIGRAAARIGVPLERLMSFYGPRVIAAVEEAFAQKNKKDIEDSGAE